MTLRQERIKASVDFILNRLLIVFFFGLLIVYASREISDLDLWLHIKTGETIVKNRTIPLSDIFSFTLGAKPWINHEWLFQVIVYLFYSFASADSLIFMQNIVLIATFLLLFLMGIKERNHIFVFVILYLTLLSMAYRFTIRPDIFSLLFLTLTLFLIRDFTQRKSNLIFLLPVCQVFWVNMHGFAFTGPLVILVFLLGEIAKRTVRLPFAWNETERLDNRQINKLLIVFGLMIAAFFINPSGIRGAIYPISVLGQISGKGKVVFQYIQELARPVALRNIFDTNYFIFYKVFVLISLFSFRVNTKHINISQLLLWMLFFLFSLLAIRNVAYFAIIAACAIFNNAQLASAHKKEPPFKMLPGILKASGIYAVLLFLFFYPAKGALKYLEASSYRFDTYELKSSLWGFSLDRYPKKAVDFLLAHDFPKHMFNDFNSGSYLIGRAYPKRQVFIDGRTELYGPDFFMQYVAVGEGKKDIIEKSIAKYAIKGFFLTYAANDLHLGLMKYLFASPQWKPVYFDEAAIIFLKETKENAALIKKYSISLKDWSVPQADFLKLGIAFRYPGPYVARARLLNMLGCYAASAREAQAALDIQPSNAEALKFMACYYLYLKEYPRAFKFIRNSLIYSSGDLYTRTRLVLVYHFLKEDDKALKVIDAIIRKSPKYPEGYYVKALIVKDTDPKKAKELLSTAIRLQSKDPKYHVLLGDVLFAENDLAAAKKEWSQGFEYDSANSELKKKLGL